LQRQRCGFRHLHEVCHVQPVRSLPAVVADRLRRMVVGGRRNPLLWLTIAAGFAASGEVPPAGHVKLAGVFALFAAGWSGAWLYTWRPVSRPTAT
jgi:hypothetical protein